MSDLFTPGAGAPVDRYRSVEKDRLRDAPKRFYEQVAIEKVEEGFAVTLDGRPLRTPGKSRLVVDRETIAEALKREWDAQAEHIDPISMPATRLANTAIDGVATQMGAVREDIVRYAGSDLLCYRAEGPVGLVELETSVWDPILTWAASELDAHFVLGQGIVPVTQPNEARAAFARAVEQVENPFQLAGLNVMTALTGSAVIALATARGRLGVDEAWSAAHVEEDWNISLWGADEEAASRRERRGIEMRTAASFVRTD